MTVDSERTDRSRLQDAICSVTFGERRDHGATLEKLGELLSPNSPVNGSTISRWQTGRARPSAEYARRLDALFGAKYRVSFVALLREALVEDAQKKAGHMGSDLPTLLWDQETTYLSVARLLEGCDPAPRDRAISFASLHGHAGKRVPDAAVAPPKTLAEAFERFDSAITDKIAGTDPPWQFRQLVNITNRERLDNVLDRLLPRDGPHFEVRALTAPSSLPMLSPLIIANEHVLLAPQDARYYRVNSALYYRGRDVAAWATAYFDSLWDLPGYRIRTPAGIDDAEVAALRTAVGRLDESGPRSSADGNRIV